MKKIQSFSPKIKMLIVGGLVALFGGSLFLQHTLAAPGQFSITGAGSVLNGNNITVNVRVNPGTPIDTIDATLTYDQAKLQFVSANSGGSAFQYELPSSGGGGSVSMVRFTSPGTVSTDALITQVTFKALVGSGSTNLQVSGTGALVGVATTPSNGSATIAFTSPASPSPAPSPPPTPSPSPSPTSPSPSPTSPGSKPSPTPSPSPPSGGSGGSSSSEGSGSGGNQAHNPDLNIEKRRIEYTKAILRAIAKSKVRVYVKYGIDEKQLVAQTPLTDFGTEHDVALDQTVLIPGTKFYYQVIAQDEQGNLTESSVADFKTKGLKVRVQVCDKNEKCLRRKKVTLFSDPVTVTTDEDGYATFDDVAPGNHRIEYKQSGQTYSKTISVGDAPITVAEDGNQKAEDEQVIAVLDDLQFADTQTSPIILPAAVAVAVLALGVVGAFAIVKRRQQNAAWQGVQTADPLAGVPPSVLPTPTDPNHPEELIQKVSGLKKPDPGSVVAPDQDKDKDQR